jgi:hypothetical protein
MSHLNKLLQNKFILYIISSIIIITIGYIDFITGDFELDVFYIAVIFLVTWFGNKYIGIAIVVESIIAEILSDYYLHHNSVFAKIYYWNTISALVIFLFAYAAAIFIKKYSDA